MNSKGIIFDTETTGLLKPQAQGIEAQPEIIEIYCLKFIRSGTELEIIDDFEMLIKPSKHFDEVITKITGLKNEDLEKEPSFSEIYNPLAEFFCGTDTLVAHNLAFDRSMLANELLRIDKVLNFPWPMNHTCTVQSTIHLEQRRLSLSKLYQYLFSREFKDAHRARNDVMALYKCYCKLIDEGIIK